MKSLSAFIFALFIALCASRLALAVEEGPYAEPIAEPDTVVRVQKFGPPFDFPASFSGNFGELRSNHFHSGLDFKTQGASGKPMRALDDGYISRIRVTHGSGYMLNVCYRNGYSTICRHLSAFVGPVAQRTEQTQYERECWEVDIACSPDEYPVRAGEVIALSGNTGYSFGPHLHLDVVDDSTGEYVDPLPFFAHIVDDHTAPRAEGIMLFPQAGQGVVDGGSHIRSYALQPQSRPTAWGLIGAGIKAYDYCDGAPNRLGVKQMTLEVDGREVFRSVVDRFLPDETRYINSWTRGQYMKAFVDKGNRLSMLHADSCRGLFTIDEERPYRLTFTLMDAWGNTRKVNFTLQGKPTDIPPVETEGKRILAYGRLHIVQLSGLDLVIPPDALYDDVRMDYAASIDADALSFTYVLAAEPIPLHTRAELSIALLRRPTADTTKYYVAQVGKDGRLSSVGGRFEGGFVHTEVRQLGTFTLAVDTLPPILTPVGPSNWGRTGRIVVKARDRETGISSYRGTIDGQYALFGKPNLVSGDLECRLDPKHVERGKMHTLELTVVDGRGNRSVLNTRFRW